MGLAAAQTGLTAFASKAIHLYTIMHRIVTSTTAMTALKKFSHFSKTISDFRNYEKLYVFINLGKKS